MDEGLIDEPNDIFDDYEAVSEHEEENTNAAGAGNDAESAETIPVPKRRIVRNPRLKFDANRLCGERGIPVLVEHFKNMKFKGKGYEGEDLDKLLSTLEHWTHRLYPSMKFSDCLRQIEKLGKKGAVKVCLGKIRLDMPILSSDFGRVDDDDNDDVRRNADSDTEVTHGTEFDHLVEDYQQTLFNKEPQNEVHEHDSISQHEQSSSADNLDGASTSASNGITEEQRLKMEQNRKLAAERLRARLSNLNTALSSTSNSFANDGSVATTSSFNQVAVNSRSNNKIINFPNAHSDVDDELNFDAEVYKKPTKRLKIDSDDDDGSVDIDDLVENSLYDESDVVETNAGLTKSQRNSFHSNPSQFPSSSKNRNSSQQQIENADILFQNLTNAKEQHDNDENSDSDVDTMVHRRLKKKHIIDSDDDMDDAADNDIASGLDSVKGTESQNSTFLSDVNLCTQRSNLSGSLLSEENNDANSNISDISHHSQIDTMKNQSDYENTDFNDEVNVNQKSARARKFKSCESDEVDQRIDNDRANLLKSTKSFETFQNNTSSSDGHSDDDDDPLPDISNSVNKKTDASNYVKNIVLKTQSVSGKSDSDDDDFSPVYHKTKKCRIDSDEDDTDNN